jgi:PD-(D/E)XK nuclease superfamily
MVAMANDKYSAVWVSNSSMSDFNQCPRLYYLRNVYKDPATRHKVNIINPSLALGQAVHEVLEALSILPVEDRFTKSLLEAYETSWKKVSGKLGGFTHPEEEKVVKARGARMLQRVMNHPGPLANKAKSFPTTICLKKTISCYAGKLIGLNICRRQMGLTLLISKQVKTMKKQLLCSCRSTYFLSIISKSGKYPKRVTGI